jgi:hypothetical protein
LRLAFRRLHGSAPRRERRLERGVSGMTVLHVIHFGCLARNFFVPSSLPP